MAALLFSYKSQVINFIPWFVVLAVSERDEDGDWSWRLETAPQSKETIKRSTNTTRQKVIFNETEYNFRQRLSSLKCRRWTQEARNWSLLVIIKHSTYLSACSKHEPHWHWHVPGWDLTAQWENLEKIAPNICVAFLLRLDEFTNQKQKQMDLIKFLIYIFPDELCIMIQNVQLLPSVQRL